MSSRRDSSYRRVAETDSVHYRGAWDDAVHYRRARKNAARQRRLWRTYVVVAAAVAVVTVFGMAFSFAASPVKHEGSVVPANASAPVSSGGAGSAGEAKQPASDGGGKDSAKQSAATSEKDLAGRDADFAVDPDRTDWNYSASDKKTVYLTIDDGPSENTQAVLDILDRYGCKATFFVVGHNDDYFPMIAEAYRRGHTIGMHTYSHDYAEVYSSVDAYFADLDAIAEVVKEQIGYVPCFIRFPGGSSNDISAKYCEGIMSELVEDVQARGFQYYDWNLSVGDGADHTADEIVEYGTADEGDKNIVLLCHDSATKQSTVEALPRIIEHYQALGYTFEAIDRDSWVCHHSVNN